MANGQIGYVSAAYITISEEQPATPATKTAYSTGDRVRVRASASTSSAILTHVNRGDSFTVQAMHKTFGTRSRSKMVQKALSMRITFHSQRPLPLPTKTAYSTGDRVRVRASASTSSAILTHVNRGDSFTVSAMCKMVGTKSHSKTASKALSMRITFHSHHPLPPQKRDIPQVTVCASVLLPPLHLQFSPM